MIPPSGEGRTSIIPVLLKHQHHKGLYNMPTEATARHLSTQLLDTQNQRKRRARAKGLIEMLEDVSAESAQTPKKVHHVKMAAGVSTVLHSPLRMLTSHPPVIHQDYPITRILGHIMSL